MKDRVHSTFPSGGAAATLVLSFGLLAGCASTPQSPTAAADSRSNLQALQNDPNLGQRARAEQREAEEAVRLAEQPLPAADVRLAEHRVYMANQKVEIARAMATTDYLEAQRQRLAEERHAARLASRTEEVDRAREQTDRARQGEAELQRQIDTLQAKATERGIVLTLGDVLFTSGSAELQSAGYDNLNRLVDFLREYPDRDVLIEGHTDNVGSAESNERLSQRRADSVRAYLARSGVEEGRLAARGMGEGRPVATNDTAAGRQQNRRVEIIIENAPQTSGVGS